MKKRFTQAQIAFALRQAESGTPIEQIIRKMGIAEATFYRWKKKYAGWAWLRCAGSSSLRMRTRGSSVW